MSFVISSLMPFPSISWWTSILPAHQISWDRAEHFVKMSTRNRYHIAGAEGRLTLSIPLAKGRDQRAAMGDILIFNKDNWQVNHWRTLESAYRRSPYYEFYEHSLLELYSRPYEKLTDFSLASIHWTMRLLRLHPVEVITDVYIKDYPEGVDLRSYHPLKQGNAAFLPYTQVFQERTGFLSDLSILDLLFCEGPMAHDWLTRNGTIPGFQRGT
jgi:hypothetical protein